MFLMFLMMFFNGQAKIYRRQKGEDKSLDKGYQQFKEHHKNIEQNGYDGNAVGQSGRHFGKNIDQADKAHDNDMTGGNIGKKPDHQYKGLW